MEVAMKLSNVSRAVVPVDHLPKAGIRARSSKEVDEGPERARNDYEIQSVVNALDLLEAICVDESSEPSGCEDEIRVTPLSQRLGMSKSAVYRLLVTFESRGYVERIAETGIYRIGVNAFETGRRLLLRMGVLRHARPVMEDLCRRCNEAVYLAIRRGNEFLFIDYADSAQQVKIAPLVGKRFPLTGAAPGLVLLAFSADADGQVLGSAISEIHGKGYHHEQGGLGEMVGCLATPFFNGFGTVAGALCLVGPTFRMSDSQVDTKFWPLFKDASDAISSRLGYFKPYAGNIRL
jgi:DNA-binding IclR family transcriptional regulator